MTLEEIVREVFEVLGEPSDLEFRDPATGVVNPASEGWRRLVSWTNSAQRDVFSFKFSNSQRPRFRLGEQHTMFSTVVLNATVALITGGVVTVPGISVVPNAFRGWLFRSKLRNFSSLVMQSYPNGTGQTNLMLLSLPPIALVPTDVCTLHKREYQFENNAGVPVATQEIPVDFGDGAPLEIIDVYEAESTARLEHMTKLTPGIVSTQEVSIPSQFYKSMQGLRFDVWPEVPTVYVVRFIKEPALLGLGDAGLSPELPVQFHPAIVLRAVWWGLVRMQENETAYARKKDFVELMMTLKTEYDHQDELGSGQMRFSYED